MLESRGSRVPSQICSGLCLRCGHRLAESPLATLEGASLRLCRVHLGSISASSPCRRWTSVTHV